ncbi:13278_t:CDS:10, partial [Racocetra fulgida]
LNSIPPTLLSEDNDPFSIPTSPPSTTIRGATKDIWSPYVLESNVLDAMFAATPPTLSTFSESHSRQSSLTSLSSYSHPLSPTISALNSPTSSFIEDSTFNKENMNSDLQSALDPGLIGNLSLPDVLYGQYLNEDDISGIRVFIRDLVDKSIIPYMEKNIWQWNEQVASSRRGITGRLLNAGRRYFITSTRTTGPAQSSQYSYIGNSSNAANTMLVDILRADYRLAHSVYDTVKKDFLADKAWKYYAGSQEMVGVCLLIAGNKSDVDHYFEQAVNAYLSVHLGDLSAALEFFIKLLRASRQPPTQQNAYLREFMYIYKQYESKTGKYPYFDQELPIPVIDDSSVKVILSNSQSSEYDEIWDVMEREFLEEGFTGLDIHGNPRKKPNTLNSDIHRTVCAVGELDKDIDNETTTPYNDIIDSRESQLMKFEDFDLETLKEVSLEDLLVTSPMPLLEATFHSFPDVLLSGEVKQVLLEINNKGQKGLTDLRVKMNSSTRNSKLNAEIWTTNNSIFKSSIKAIPLPPQEVNNICSLAPGKTTLIPIWIRGDRIGKHSFRFLFTYESENNNSAMRYRSLRYLKATQVYPSLKINAFTRPSIRGLNEFILGIEIENLQTTSEYQFQLAQLSSISPSWTISLVNESLDSMITPEVFSSKALELLLSGQKDLKSEPSPIDLIVTNVPFVRFSLNSRVQWRTNTLINNFPVIPASKHRTLFPLYNTNDVDLSLYWNIPTLSRQGHHYIIGINLGVQQNPFRSQNIAAIQVFQWTGPTSKCSILSVNEEQTYIFKACFVRPGVYDVNRWRLTINFDQTITDDESKGESSREHYATNVCEGNVGMKGYVQMPNTLRLLTLVDNSIDKKSEDSL